MLNIIYVYISQMSRLLIFNQNKMTQRILHEMNFTGLQYNRNMEYSKIEIEAMKFLKV